jgi:hypothetical protein
MSWITGGRPRRTPGLGRIGLAAIVLAASLTVAAAPSPAGAAPVEPANAYEDEGWRIGSVGFYQLSVTSGGLTYFYTHMMNRASYQGPPSAPLRAPRVGEVFYLRLDTAMVFDGFGDWMQYQMDLSLPDGLVPAVSDTYPLYCGVVDISGDETVYKREYPGCSAQRFGIYYRFTTIDIYENEGAMIWVPVTATAPLSGATVQLLSRRTAGDVDPPVNPLLSQLEVTVGAGAPAAPRSVAAAAATRSLNVSWAAPSSNGGGRITGYTARAWSKRSGGVKVGQCTTTGTRRCTITGLRRGTRVFVDVVARNSIGTSRPSSPRVGRAPL